MKTVIVVVAYLAFAGQTPVQTVPVVITSDYYAQPKVLVLHALNNSGKDITGYSIIIRHKNPDGTIGKGSGRTESMSDMMSVLITQQMAKDPAVFPADAQIMSADIYISDPQKDALYDSQAKKIDGNSVSL
jgi:hypothetical protein